MDVSDFIIIARRRLGMTRLQFARRLGLTTSCSVWQYEKKLRIPSVKVWCKLFEIESELKLGLTTDAMKSERPGE